MKSEYGKIDGWQEWYNNTEVDCDKKILLKGIVDMRNRSVKKNDWQLLDKITRTRNYFNYVLIQLISKCLTLYSTGVR